MKLSFLLIQCALGLVFAYPPNSKPQLAPECDPSTCVLPMCRCFSTDIPNALDPKTVPQMVVLTFDDAVTTLNYNDYYSKLLFNRTNPNGCGAKATFFLSHEYSDYAYVHDLYSRGHDIASHSITHVANQTYWSRATTEDYQQEMVDMRTIAETFALLAPGHIVGARIPFLQMGGDTMFDTFSHNGFSWDSTWSTSRYTNPALWPYTLDYLSGQDCPIGSCPTESYSGFWEFPMVDLTDKDGYPCAMVDGCSRPENAQEAYELLMSNFLVHYNATSLSNRAPYGLYMHAAWFGQPGTWDGYLRFIEEVNKLEDVYFVTVQEALAWVLQPTTLDNIKDFAPWSENCKQRSPNICNRGQSCGYQTSRGERYMQSCAPCPPNYPWLGNPLGL